MSKETKKYKVTLETTGIVFKSSADDLQEAIFGLGVEWHNIKAKGVLTVLKGKQRVEKLYIITKLRRIFSNKIVRQTEAKRLELLLK